MYDQAQSAAILGNSTRVDNTRPLESLPGAVQRINSATVTLQAFIDRFHGAGPAEPPLTPPEGQVAQPYGMSLERLFGALDRLETRIDALNSIG